MNQSFFSHYRPAVQEPGSARRAAFQCAINAMNTSRLFYKLAPASNGRNEFKFPLCARHPKFKECLQLNKMDELGTST